MSNDKPHPEGLVSCFRVRLSLICDMSGTVTADVQDAELLCLGCQA